MDKSQFDDHLGGNVTLSHDLAMKKLISARANELAAMTHSLENPSQTKLLFQKLPIHMRRRVMSHNAKRMPRKLREAHIKQMEKSGLPPKVKRPSRKHRRRPQNLLSFTYNKRKFIKGWLETHIWHAKRFHMCEKWGYKIAHFSNDRNFRATYRALSKNCIIQDISYYSCIELIGPQDFLIEKLKVHTQNELPFEAKIYLNGLREGNLVFYKKDNSPIGSINFHWQPVRETMKRAIWIWIHPAIFNDIFEELLSTFNFIETDSEPPDQHHQFRKDNVNKLFITNDSHCSMELLRDSFNRFRIRGPCSIALVTDALKLSMLPSNSNNSVEGLKNSWYETWYENSINKESFQVQADIYDKMKTLNSGDQFPSKAILALTVIDPRIFLPQIKRQVIFNDDNKPALILKLPEYSSHSPLWERQFRKMIKENGQPSKDLKQLRNNNLVPGVDNDIEIDQSNMGKVPVILIQYPGSNCKTKSIGFASGIDIILPSGWALPFWFAFTYRSARPIGLREHKSTIFESLSVLNFSEVNHPDTAAYVDDAVKLKNELIKKYFKRPPNKRINYAKFSISSPFFCEWQILMKEWTNRDTFQVLRNRQCLNQLNSMWNNFAQTHVRKKCLADNTSIDKDAFGDDGSYLVPVRLTIVGKGKPKKFSLICIPKVNDLTCPKAPVEPKRTDPLQKKRKLYKIEHKQFMMRTSKKRLKKQSPEIAENNKIKRINFIEDSRKIMEKLYLPECDKVRHSCDREVMGYIVEGDFCFTEAKAVGWGYIALNALFELIERKIKKVLIRNVQSRQYRWANLDIIDFC